MSSGLDGLSLHISLSGLTPARLFPLLRVGLSSLRAQTQALLSPSVPGRREPRSNTRLLQLPPGRPPSAPQAPLGGARHVTTGAGHLTCGLDESLSCAAVFSVWLWLVPSSALPCVFETRFQENPSQIRLAFC